MIIQVLHCPHCPGTDIVRYGKTRQGKQRYCCRERRCAGRTFLLEYSGSHLRRDNLVSVLYAEELSSTKSSVFLQRTDRHGILVRQVALKRK